MILAPDLRLLAPLGFNLSFRADVLIGGEKTAELPISSGDITDEADAEVRRRCNLVVPGLHEYIPSHSRDFLWPVGNIEVGLVANMGFPNLAQSGDLPLGVFRVQKPRMRLEPSGDRSVSFEGYDRALTVGRAKFRSAVTLPKNTNVGDFIRDIIEPRTPEGTVLEFATTDVSPYTIQWDQGDNPWVKCQELARGHGFTLYFNAAGVCILEEITDPLDRPPDFIHTTGETLEVLSSTGPLAEVTTEELSTVKGVEWTIDDEDTFNHIIVRGENTDSYGEVMGEAFDADPLSPTWVGAAASNDPDFGSSPFGVKTDIRTNQFVFNKDQATKSANAELLMSVGLQEVVVVRTFWLPHEGNDIVRIIVPELELDNTYVLDGITMQLDVEGDLQLATRQRRTSGIAI